MATLKQNLAKIARQQKWLNLGAVAGQARLMQEAARRESKDGIAPNINHFLKTIYNLENQDLKTFKAWKNEGFIVKKGEKGFVFFSAPRVTEKKSKITETTEKSERFFTCHLFASSQVEALTQNETII